MQGSRAVSSSWCPIAVWAATVACTLVFFSAPCACAAAADPSNSEKPAQSATGTKRALLVGINNYKAVEHLRGSLNDVAAMRQILTTRWGFSPDNVVTLTEEAATRDAILRSLEQLVSESGPNDTVVFHYSGHGSQVKDLNGDEEDGLDETLVPYDGRTPGVPDIVDDELDVIFSKLKAGTALIILDSCHSGTGTRGIDFRPRGIPQDTRLEVYQSPAVRPIEGVSTRAIIPRVESRQLVMSAVPANQEALDGPIDGEYHGVFTFVLSKALAAAPANASAREVFAGVGQEIRRLQAKFANTAMPEPQLEGPPGAIDGPLLAWNRPNDATAPTSQPRLAWLETRPETDGQVSLTNGALLGAAAGSTWAIYPPGETAFVPGRALALATVITTKGTDSLATLEPATTHIVTASRAVALLPSASAQRTTLRILETAKFPRAKIEAMLLHALSDVDIVGPERPARFLVDVQGDLLRLLSSDGRTALGTFDLRTDQWGAAANRVIARWTQSSQLLSLDNPLSQIRIQAGVVGGQIAVAHNATVAAESQPAQLHIRRANEPRAARNSLQLAITVSTDAYLTIVDVDSGGNMNLLFPNPYQRADFWPDGHVPGKRPLLIPDSLVFGGRAGFFWDYGPPAGLETIRVFASTDSRTAQLIRDRVRTLSRATEDSAAAATGRAVEFERLRHELAGTATRGIILQKDPNADTSHDSGNGTAQADWAATSVTVAIAE
jgi:hypothetical protein